MRRLVEEKGFLYIFSAIKQLVEKYPNIRLVIYETVLFKTKLESFIKKINLTKLSFERTIKYEDLLKELSNYDLFVSRNRTKYVAEAFHMGNMEAMSSNAGNNFGNCGGIPLVVKDKALICGQRSDSTRNSSIYR